MVNRNSPQDDFLNKRSFSRPKFLLYNAKKISLKELDESNYLNFSKDITLRKKNFYHIRRPYRLFWALFTFEITFALIVILLSIIASSIGIELTSKRISEDLTPSQTQFLNTIFILTYLLLVSSFIGFVGRVRNAKDFFCVYKTSFLHLKEGIAPKKILQFVYFDLLKSNPTRRSKNVIDENVEYFREISEMPKTKFLTSKMYDFSYKNYDYIFYGSKVVGFITAVSLLLVFFV